jgi:hypothetical protein
MKKLIFALIVIAALLVVAMPVAAQGPYPTGNPFNPYIPSSVWYNRTSQMTAAWAGDPFGGNPRLAIEVKYEPDGKGGVAAKMANASFPYTGIVAKFGPTPWTFNDILPGGMPSSMSGDGSAPRKAIYIGGAWADKSVNPAAGPGGAYMGATNLQTRAADENPFELPACATVKIPAGNSKWFKFDTWKNEPSGQALGAGTDNTYAKVNTQIWVDDELDGATAPSGSAVFGAANKYNWGTADDDAWTTNFSGVKQPQTRESVNGFFMAVYGPDVLAPNYAFAAPNAWLFTLNVGATGGLSRTCTAAAFAGQPCVTAASGGNSAPAGVSASNPHTNISSEGYVLGSPVAGTAANAVSVYGTFNPSQPSHLLWVEGTWDGWMFARVINQMIWDGTVTVCSYRNLSQY